MALTDNINYELPIRTTYLLAAGQIVRHQKAHIPYPGGCKIGSRGYDLHIMVWEKLGCKVEEKEKYKLWNIFKIDQSDKKKTPKGAII